MCVISNHSYSIVQTPNIIFNRGRNNIYFYDYPNTLLLLLMLYVFIIMYMSVGVSYNELVVRRQSIINKRRLK